MDIYEKHKLFLYPTVRVRTTKAGGSGTVLYSKPIPGSEREYESYVLTNHHVVESNISIGKKWSTLLKRDIQTDVLSEVDVEFFDFEYDSWQGGSRLVRANIMCYDNQIDLALLKLQSIKPCDYVARMFPRDEHRKRLRIFQEVHAVGCGLGHPPLVTSGQLNGFDDVIDNYPYILSSAPTIFGNSGGSLYLQETGEFIGVPARIAVTGGWLGGSDAITHLSWAIPIWTIYQFLEDQVFNFIYDPSCTSSECEKKRKEKRERDEEKIAVDLKKDSESNRSGGKAY